METKSLLPLLLLLGACIQVVSGCVNFVATEKCKKQDNGEYLCYIDAELVDNDYLMCAMEEVVAGSSFPGHTYTLGCYATGYKAVLDSQTSTINYSTPHGEFVIKATTTTTKSGTTIYSACVFACSKDQCYRNYWAPTPAPLPHY